MIKKIFLLPVVVLISFTALSQTATFSKDTFYAGFVAPPNSAKPRVWWHWMNGNITKDGIRKDLQWMHRVGIGGFQNFDASLLTPQIVEKAFNIYDAWMERCIQVYYKTCRFITPGDGNSRIAGLE